VGKKAEKTNHRAARCSHSVSKKGELDQRCNCPERVDAGLSVIWVRADGKAVAPCNAVPPRMFWTAVGTRSKSCRG
jgi:hypothetical protein